MTAMNANETAIQVLSSIRRGIRAAMPDIEKAVEEAANFDRAFKREQKKIQEKIYGSTRRTKTDPV